MDVISIEQDLKQREQALNIHESFIIQAPAGSGKTELLIQRLLVLLANVNKPEEILAITFTKKAANEMRERVIKALKEAVSTTEPDTAHKRTTWQLAKNVLKRDQQFNWQLTQNPNQLHIKTIDSLCSYLTGQLPLLAQFGSQPSIAETATYLYEEAAEQVLLQVEGEPVWAEAIGELLLHLDNDLTQLKTLLVALLARRDQWLPHIFGEHDQSILPFLEQQVKNIAKDALTTVQKLFPSELLMEIKVLLKYTLQNLKQNDHLTDDFTTWYKITNLLLTKEYTWRKTVNATNGFPSASSTKDPAEKQLFNEYKERLKNLILTVEENNDLRLALEDISRLPAPGLQFIDSKILEYLIPVLKLSAAQLRITFQQHGKIDFVENALAALAALGSEEDPTNLALALDYKIQHILIDEFQDTSSTQYQLLRKLTYGWQTGDGRSLFVVGDPMQSIYRFREAEVGLFLRMRQYGLGNLKLTPLTLSLNFRSTPKIIDWNNKHFSIIFPQHTNFSTGAVNYSPSVTQKSDNDSEVEIVGFDENDSPSQPGYIINKINQWQQHYPEDNIAILVRSRSHLKDIIPALRSNGITYQAIEIDPLSTRQHIIDLCSLTRALLHLADRVAWLATLRAPWCGLTLADLLVIANRNKHYTLWERLNESDIHLQLSSQGQISLKRLLPVLQRALALRGRISLREWIETTWLLLGGPACLKNETELSDAKKFFETLSTLDKENPHFSTEQLNEKINQAYAAAEGEAKIQLMTIHAAKGLEFDSVILPHLEKSLPADDKSLLLWMEHTLQNKETALLLAPIKASDAKQNITYDYIRWQQKIKSQFETDRLFYVAATRAKKRLLLAYNRQAKLASDSFLKKLEPFLHNVTNKESKIEDKQSEHASHPLLSRLSPAWQNPFKIIHQPNTSLHNTFTGFILGTDLPRKIGITIHTLLQQLAIHSIAWWQSLNEEEKIILIENLLSHHNLDNQEKLEAQCHILNAINSTVQDKRGQWILHSHLDAKAEYAVTAKINDEYNNFVIDRTFIDEQGTRWIIDYKTSHPAPNVPIETFLAEEKNTYADKMQLYAEVMRRYQPTEKNIKLGLYFPLVQGWLEWQPTSNITKIVATG